jgi:hypothetical protein
VFPHYENDTSQFAAGKAAAVVKANGIEPHLGAISIAFDMDVGRLVAVAGEEETAIRTDPEYGGHRELYYPARLGRTAGPCCHITPQLVCVLKRADGENVERYEPSKVGEVRACREWPRKKVLVEQRWRESDGGGDKKDRATPPLEPRMRCE